MFMSDIISGHGWKLIKSEMLRNSLNKYLYDAKTRFTLAYPGPAERPSPNKNYSKKAT